MKIHKIGSALTLLTAAVFTFSGCGQAASDGELNINTNDSSAASPAEITLPEGFTRFDHPTQKYSLGYPSDWSQQEDEASGVTGFISPSEGEEDFTDNVNVVAEATGNQTITLEQYTKQSLDQLEKILPGVAIEESAATTLAGLPAHRVIYSGSTLGFNLKWMQIWTLSDTSAYVLTYTATQDAFDTYRPQVDQIVSTFTLP